MEGRISGKTLFLRLGSEYGGKNFGENPFLETRKCLWRDAP